MGGNDSGGSTTKCGLIELLIFIAAIVSGTACSICSKTMMDLHGVGITGEVEQFQKPIFQTFGMFVGMTFGLVMHWAVLYFKLPFPGYEHAEPKDDKLNDGAAAASYGSIDKEKDPLIKDSNAQDSAGDNKTLPTWMYFFLAIPSIFDLGATLLCMMGLQYLDVSIYQLLRGSGV
jgi:hypothetical protein